MMFVSVLYVYTGVGGCEWPISSRSVRMYVAFWQFSNNPPNFASADYAMRFITILNYICTGPFFRGIAFIGVLDFGPRKKYPPALLPASGSEM